MSIHPDELEKMRKAAPAAGAGPAFIRALRERAEASADLHDAALAQLRLVREHCPELWQVLSQELANRDPAVGHTLSELALFRMGQRVYTNFLGRAME